MNLYLYNNPELKILEIFLNFVKNDKKRTHFRSALLSKYAKIIL